MALKYKAVVFREYERPSLALFYGFGSHGRITIRVAIRLPYPTNKWDRENL